MAMAAVMQAALVAPTVAEPAAPLATPVPAGMVSASSLASVVKGLQDAGYRAEIKKNDSGKPYVESATNGSSFAIDFYSCDDEKLAIGCKTLILSSWWSAAPYLTIGLANEYNSASLFGRAYLNGKGELVLEVVLTTVGGVPSANFKDFVDWYTSADADLKQRVDKAEAASKKPGAKA